MSYTLKSTAVIALASASAIGVVAGFSAQPKSESVAAAGPRVAYRTVDVEGQQIAYREAGPAEAPTVVLLHGFPSSSHMFRNLIPMLAARYHVLAPDYPGFGNSSMPSVTEFSYTFDHLSEVVDQWLEGLGVNSYSLYVMDYGAPVGFRLATRHPERVQSLIIQNGNAYEEGLEAFWDPIRAYWAEPSEAHRSALEGLLTLDATKWQYTNGVRDIGAISPDAWHVDQHLLDRPGNHAIQLALFYDYRTNLPLYPKWQKYLRTHQPPVLIAWGKNDAIFPAAGAEPYKRDVKTLEYHLLDTGHFALEEDGEHIGSLMLDFLDRHVSSAGK